MTVRSHTPDFPVQSSTRGVSHLDDPQIIAAKVMEACGPSAMLHVGSSSGALVQALLSAGVDARGVDATQVAVNDANGRMPGRFQVGSVLRLPYPNGSFDTLISINGLEQLTEPEIPRALAEMARVSRHAVFLCIRTLAEGDARPATLQRRPWWEQCLFEAGFRKHPRYYRLNAYDALEYEPSQIIIVMEKVPSAALPRYPLEAIQGGEVLPADMLRCAGRGSDARLIRYHLSGQYIRPGDTVIELDCGTGDGLHLMRHTSAGNRFIGFDAQPSTIEYARANFGDESRAIEFRVGATREALASLADHSVELVLALNLLSNQSNPRELLKEIERVLIPGGRVIVCAVRRPTSDSALTVEQLHALLSAELLAENVYQQHADAPPATSPNDPAGGRWLRETSWQTTAELDGQWWIATAIRDPLGLAASITYRETVFSNIGPDRHSSTDYARWYLNPWIAHSMIHVGYRVKSAALLAELANRLLAISPSDSADYGAALCILAYRRLENVSECVHGLEFFREAILRYLDLKPGNSHVLRWQISLSFALAQLELNAGNIGESRRLFEQCSQMDPLPFGIHLATKPAESFFWRGWLALNQGDALEAERAWRAGLDFGARLLCKPIDEVLMNRSDPNIFDHGDGMREFVHAIESITKCANGVHLRQRERQRRAVDWTDVHKTFRNRSEQLGRELREAQRKLAKVTTELIDTRNDLLARTKEVDIARNDLVARTREVDIARKDLIDRTRELDTARDELRRRAAEMNPARQKDDKDE